MPSEDESAIVGKTKKRDPRERPQYQQSTKPIADAIAFGQAAPVASRVQAAAGGRRA